MWARADQEIRPYGSLNLSTTSVEWVRVVSPAGLRRQRGRTDLLIRPARGHVDCGGRRRWTRVGACGNRRASHVSGRLRGCVSFHARATPAVAALRGLISRVTAPALTRNRRAPALGSGSVSSPPIHRVRFFAGPTTSRPPAAADGQIRAAAPRVRASTRPCRTVPGSPARGARPAPDPAAAPDRSPAAAPRPRSDPQPCAALRDCPSSSRGNSGS